MLLCRVQLMVIWTSFSSESYLPGWGITFVAMVTRTLIYSVCCFKMVIKLLSGTVNELSKGRILMDICQPTRNKYVPWIWYDIVQVLRMICNYVNLSPYLSLLTSFELWDLVLVPLLLYEMDHCSAADKNNLIHLLPFLIHLHLLMRIGCVQLSKCGNIWMFSYMCVSSCVW